MEPATTLGCPSCGASNPIGFRFCGTCGHALDRTCPSCGASMPAETRFCGSCGASLAPAAPDARTADERKVVTVLFADLVASTELATRLDPEDLHRVLTAYFDAMAAVLARHGGIVEKFIGDAVVGVFGAPVTHEDDPIRAVRSGLAMISALEDVNDAFRQELGQDLALRVGVHTGEVVTSGGATAQALVTGDTTSVAARLQTIAPPGGVVVSGRTRRDAARSFTFDALGEVELKGVPGPLHAWLVRRESESVPGDGERPFVGRVDELALLETLLRRCEREGTPHIATIVGAAGVGKSRLAFEFTRQAGVRTLHGRCLPYGSGLRLWPLAEMVKTEASILDSDPPDVIVAKAQDALGWRFETGPEATLTVLLSSIGIPVDPDPLADLGPEAGQRMIVNAWSRYFTTLAAEGPALVWIEDLHWADDALFELLDRAVSRVRAPLLFLCPARPDLFDRRLTWGRSGAVSIFELSTLSATESASLVSSLLDGEGDAELRDAIAERTGGNPFFATELVQTLVEDGSIVRAEGGWRASGDITATMPDTVQAAIAARIDRLGTTEKSVLQTASVVGRTFWVGVWDQLSGPGVDDAIDVLIDRGLVRPRRSSRLAGADEFTFEHALIRDVVYAGLPKTRRADAHRSALEWMQGAVRGREDEFAEVIAYHALAAGDSEATARFSMLAGHRHRRTYAADEAIRWYQQAADAADLLPDDQSSRLRAEILHSRGDAFGQLGRFDEALLDYRAALDLARARQRTWYIAQELAAIADALRSLERYDDAEAVIPEALQAAREAGWEYVEARTLCLAGQLAWDRGDPERARRQLDESLRISQEARDLESEAFARTALAEIGLCAGPFDRAIADAARARHLWLRLGHRLTAAETAQMLGFLRLLTGDLDGAQRLFDDALEVHRDLGMTHEEPLPLAGLGLVAATRGDLGTAMSLLDGAVELATTSGAAKGTITAHLSRVIVWQMAGAWRRADTDLRALDPSQPPASYLAPVRLASHAWLLLASGDPEGAHRGFQRARSWADGQLLSRIACGRIEILAWHQESDPRRMADAASWLLEVASACPAALALARWAIARAGDGDPADAVEPARRSGDRTVQWRVLALAAEDADTRGDRDAAGRLRSEAQQIIHALVDSVRDEGLRAALVSDAEAANLLGDGAIPRPGLT